MDYSNNFIPCYLGSSLKENTKYTDEKNRKKIDSFDFQCAVHSGV